MYDGEPYLPGKSGLAGRRRHLLTRAYVTSFEPIGDLPEILPLARGVPTTPEVVTPDLAEELKSFATLKHRAQQLLAETGRWSVSSVPLRAPTSRAGGDQRVLPRRLDLRGVEEVPGEVGAQRELEAAHGRQRRGLGPRL